MGFSFVLISRLHLVEDSSKLRLLPVLVIVLDLTVHTLVLVGKAGQLTSQAWKTILYFTPIFFTVQETFLSSLYIYLFIKFMRHNSYGSRTRSMFKFLLFAELIVVCFDVAMVTLNSLRYEIAKAILTPFFYASKLEIEFMVLNRLMNFRQKDGELQCSDQGALGGGSAPAVDSSGLNSNGGSSSMHCASEGASDGTMKDLSMVFRTQTFSASAHAENDNIAKLERHYLGRNNIKE